MNDVVLDASALIALLRGEPGADVVQAHLGRTLTSAVNFSEAIAKFMDYGIPFEAARTACARFAGEIVPFDEAVAADAARLRPMTRSFGLSFADRACLALSATRNATVLTADRRWAQLEIGVQVIVIR